MVDIAAIHGINMHRSQRSAMQQSWHTAMVDGLANIRSRHTGTLSLECAFYGHEYNDGKAGGEPEYAAIDIAPGLEEELLIAIGDGLEEDAGGDNEGTGTKLYLPGMVQRALAAIQRSDLFDGRDSRAIAFVKQVNRYLTDPDFRKLVHTEVSAVMEQSPRVVIAHSLGSVIAYEWLRENEPENPPALITLGSPLGLEPVRRRLLQRPGPLGWPGQVRSWTNIAARHDAVAMVKKLAPLYSPDVRDLPCDNPRRSAHSALVYLANVRTSRAIEVALA
ncbi:hypothetical protein E1286_34175 [Nonomuraea terrae]|uniref:Alpha/beta hydrolase n=1 Tax=Nonomuraea terrae TaxID=2530383 RepID=A0A4R4Y8M9_9ACTN|nr:hypothetical protein [Nonomuraea terrae]TDD40716.1 hypothetical protein E1286_34175 [Nonomuraea terrae]